MRRRHQPKRFAPPRSRAARDALWPAAVRAFEILRDLWPAPGDKIFDRPAWAHTARKFGWITEGEFYAVERLDTGRRTPSIERLMYEDGPMFRMLSRGAA